MDPGRPGVLVQDTTAFAPMYFSAWERTEMRADGPEPS